MSTYSRVANQRLVEDAVAAATGIVGDPGDSSLEVPILVIEALDRVEKAIKEGVKAWGDTIFTLELARNQGLEEIILAIGNTSLPPGSEQLCQWLVEMLQKVEEEVKDAQATLEVRTDLLLAGLL